MNQCPALQVYDPIVAWASRFLQAEFETSDSIFGAQQPQRAVEAVQRYLEGTDHPEPWSASIVTIKPRRGRRLTKFSLQDCQHGSWRPLNNSSAHADPF